MRGWRLPAALLGVLVVAGPAAAHPAPFSYVDLRLGGPGIDLSLVAHVFDLGHDLHVEPPERLLDRSVAEGDTVYLDVRGKASAFTVVKPPFVQASTKS
jgi:hypothetical protein